MMARGTSIVVLSLGLLLAGQSVWAQVNARDGARIGSSGTTKCKGIDIGLTFESAGQTFVFDVLSLKNGSLKVQSQDCCVPGDIWRVGVNQNGTGFIGRSNAGTGDTETFTGKVTKDTEAGNPYVVIVSYDQGVDDFPAGMDVCFEGAVDISDPRPATGE
jgi:hypothetical protein